MRRQRPDLTGVRVERGDYVEAQLAERVNTAELVGDIGTHWLKLGERPPTVCFATGVEHSVAIRNEFRRLGVMAEHIDGGTPARRARGDPAAASPAARSSWSPTAWC